MRHLRQVPEMEAALAARGVPVSEMCRRAGIAETTWGRWKRGNVGPTLKSWEAVSSAYEEILKIPEKKGAA